MWQPSCTHDAIKARSECYAQIRAFFMAREVLEVETPILSQAGATDPLLASIKTDAHSTQYLQTSPEFPMKRLLASGSGPIYQICKCFREAEIGGRHNPEFTMLEWYRPGFDLSELMTEIAELSEALTGRAGFSQLTYLDAFSQYLNIDPFAASLDELVVLASEHAAYEGEMLERDAYLDLLLSCCIEPKLGWDKPCFLLDYPASQASLAKTRQDEFGNEVARRAELYIDGIEIANAYDELTDAKEQRARFEADNVARQALGLPKVELDERLLEALAHGLPECSGVALGIDRILMIRQSAGHIKEVLCFDHERV